jgi:hypothetical protein
VTDTPTQIMALERAFVGPGSGKSLGVGLPYGEGAARSAYALATVLEGASFPAARRLVLDVDIVLDELSLQYAVLVAFQVTGVGCATFPGLAVTPYGFRRSEDVQGAPFHVVRIGAPFHVRLIAAPRAGASTDVELSIDGAPVSKGPVSYASSCGYVGALVGTFFTGGEPGAVRARFDRLVVRVE